MNQQKRGLREKGWLEFKYRATGEPIRFPTGTVYGVEDGPTLVVVGGMHGSEYAGIEATIRLFNEVDPTKLKGTLMVGMIYNLPAFLNHVAFVVPHDGKNPASTFPGSPVGTYSEAMAYYFDQELLSKADYYVEMHGGDIPEKLTPLTVCPVTGDDEVDAKSMELATVYNLPHVLTYRVSDAGELGQSALGVVAMRGKPAVLTEAGNQGILRMEDVEMHLVGLRNILIHLGMTSGQIVDTVKPTVLEGFTTIRSEVVGMWYPRVSLYERISKGQVLGVIRDYFGQDIVEIKAPSDGLVALVRTSPLAQIGTPLVEYPDLPRHESEE
jgi:predicted deacylase